MRDIKQQHSDNGDSHKHFVSQQTQPQLITG